MDFKKIGAWGILITMLSGLALEIRTQTISNKDAILGILEREKTSKELLIEIKQDVKHLIRKTEIK